MPQYMVPLSSDNVHLVLNLVLNTLAHFLVQTPLRKMVLVSNNEVNHKRTKSVIGKSRPLEVTFRGRVLFTPKLGVIQGPVTHPTGKLRACVQRVCRKRSFGVVLQDARAVRPRPLFLNPL